MSKEKKVLDKVSAIGLERDAAIQKTRRTLEALFPNRNSRELLGVLFQRCLQELVDIKNKGEAGVYSAMYEEIKVTINFLVNSGIQPQLVYELLAPKIRDLRLALQPGTVMPLSEFDEDFKVIAGPKGWKPQAIYTTTG